MEKHPPTESLKISFAELVNAAIDAHQDIGGTPVIGLVDEDVDCFIAAFIEHGQWFSHDDAGHAIIDVSFAGSKRCKTLDDFEWCHKHVATELRAWLDGDLASTDLGRKRE
jgi:hypothetical protein